MRPDLKQCFNTSECDENIELYSPLLNWANKYDRGVGYFTSGWLKKNAESMIQFIKNNGKARWITSPILDENDYDMFYQIEEYQERFKFINEIVEGTVDDVFDGIQQHTREFLAWLIYDGIIEIRFAIPACKLIGGDFHDKFGIGYNGDDIISFNGSQNDSVKGSSNYESFKVFSSWKGHYDFIEPDIKRFEKLWNNIDRNVTVYQLSEAIRKKIFTKRSPERPYSGGGIVCKWRHQDEAVDAFLKVEHGILEMATGTGKTRTALKIIKKMRMLDMIDSVIVTTYGTDLLDQWGNEFIGDEDFDDWLIYRKYEKFNEMGQYYTSPKDGILIISRTPQNLRTLITKLDDKQKERTIIIFDEIHGLGSDALRNELTGVISTIKYRLGLSATPEREYDETGTNFIEDEVGGIFFQFGIAEAIKRGILCEFDYQVLGYHLTDEEKKEIRSIIAKYENKRKNGEIFSLEEMYRDIAEVRKQASIKIPVFDEYISRNKNLLDYCIIFVQNSKYGEMVQNILIKYISDYHVYYAATQKNHLEQFADGKTKVLITCKKLNEGIDIKKCKNIILFSSDRSKLVTIQRIGRCLRTTDDVTKRSTVIDFIDDEYEADAYRREWVSEISRVEYSC